MDFSIIQQGFEILSSPWVLLSVSVGLIAGILVGALPGLTATMAVAVLSPFTFFMDPSIGIPFLLGIYKGAIYGGSIPAILINTPGTAAAAATVLDGYPLAKQGKSRKALELSLYCAVVSDLISTLVLLVVAIPLATIAIRFGPSEFALLYLIALTMIATVSGGSPVKGVIAAVVGILFGVVGLDPMSGAQRFTFGVTDLLSGVSLIPLLIGMFALSEILMQIAIPPNHGSDGEVDSKDNGSRLSFTEFWKLKFVVLRSTTVGIILGALPGLGAEISCWIAYGLARGRSRTPEKFGKGSLEGLAAAESGNNAVVPAALIPMTIFGIPGDTITAVLIGALMAQGMMPGPLLVREHPGFLFGMFLILMITVFMLLVFGQFAIRWLRGVARIPGSLLYPCVFLLCVCGSYAVNSSAFDVVILVFGGLLGYMMRRLEFPIPPLIIGLLLGPGLETSLRQSLVFSSGSLEIFWTRPGSLALTILFFAVVFIMVIRRVKDLRMRRS